MQRRKQCTLHNPPFPLALWRWKKPGRQIIYARQGRHSLNVSRSAALALCGKVAGGLSRNEKPDPRRLPEKGLVRVGVTDTLAHLWLSRLLQTGEKPFL